MKILVIVKQMPVREQEGCYQEVGFLNESDKNVISVALELKRQSRGTVTAAGCGDSMEKILKETLALGVDQAFLLQAKEAPVEPMQAAKLFAAAFHSHDYDLILCGRQSIDGDSVYFAGLLSHWLKLPFGAYAREIYYRDESLFIKKETADGEVLLRAEGPVLLTFAGEQRGALHPSMEEIQKVYSGEKAPQILSEGRDFIWQPETAIEELQCMEQKAEKKQVQWLEGANEREKAVKLLRLLKDAGLSGAKG